jgi:hypothetical protein
VHPNTPKPNQGYKLTPIQQGVTKAKTLNMARSKIVGFHHLQGLGNFKINFIPWSFHCSEIWEKQNKNKMTT